MVAANRANKTFLIRVTANPFDCRSWSHEASSIAIDVSASQFPQLPVPRHSPEQVGGCRATNAWLERYPLRQHKDLLEHAHIGCQGDSKTIQRYRESLATGFQVSLLLCPTTK